MTTYKDWYIFFVGAALLSFSTDVAWAESFLYDLSPKSIEPGESAILVLKVEDPTAIESDNPSVSLRDELLLGAKSIKILSQKKQKLENSFVWLYEFTSYTPGEAVLPPIEITVGGNTYSTERMKLNVTSTRPVGDEALRESYGLVDPPLRIPRWLWYLPVVLILAGALTYLAIIVYRRYRPLLRAPLQSSPPPPIEDPKEWLKKRLKLIRSQLNREDAEDRIVDELTLVLRTYFQRQMGVPAPAWTTSEFEKHLQKDSAAKLLHQVFAECDSFKFQSTKDNFRVLTLDCLDRSESILCI